MDDVEVYSEQMWEIFDPANAQVIAHFFHEGYARMFAEMMKAAAPLPRA